MLRWWPSFAMRARLWNQPRPAAHRAELMAKWDSDFIPYTFQIPISVAVGKVTGDYRLLDVVMLDEPEFRPHAHREVLARLGDLSSARRW